MSESPRKNIGWLKYQRTSVSGKSESTSAAKNKLKDDQDVGRRKTLKDLDTRKYREDVRRNTKSKGCRQKLILRMPVGEKIERSLERHKIDFMQGRQYVYFFISELLDFFLISKLNMGFGLVEVEVLTRLLKNDPKSSMLQVVLWLIVDAWGSPQGVDPTKVNRRSRYLR